MKKNKTLNILLRVAELGREIQGQSPKMVPVACLGGEPGVGKTHWSKELANMLGIDNDNEIFIQSYKNIQGELFMFDVNFSNMMKSINTIESSKLKQSYENKVEMINSFISMLSNMDVNQRNRFLSNTDSIPSSIESLLSDLNTSLSDCKNMIDNVNIDFLKLELLYRTNKLLTEAKPLSAIQDGVLFKALKRSNEKKVLLILDELDKAGEDIDTMLLNFFQNLELWDPIESKSIKGNINNLMVVVTTNDQRRFNEALFRRMTYIAVPYPSIDEQVSIIKSMIPVEYKLVSRRRDDVEATKLIKELCDVAHLYRQDMNVTKKVITNELSDAIRLVLAGGDNSKEDIMDIMTMKFSDIPEDQKIASTLLKTWVDKFYNEVKK